MNVPNPLVPASSSSPTPPARRARASSSSCTRAAGPRRRSVRRRRLHARALLGRQRLERRRRQRQQAGRTRRATPPTSASSTRARCATGSSLTARAEVVCYGEFQYDDANTTGQGAYTLTNLRAGVRGSALFGEAVDPQRVRHALHPDGVSVPGPGAVGIRRRNGRAADVRGSGGCDVSEVRFRHETHEGTKKNRLASCFRAFVADRVRCESDDAEENCTASCVGCRAGRSRGHAAGPAAVALGDWPEARGPNRDGISTETGLVEKWALNGENFLWRAPYGGRSAPIVMGNRVYVQNPSGRGPTLQERVMALDADTGKVVWEYKFNIFQSDVPPHRVGWASPAADPETGNIYALGVGAHGHRAQQGRQAAVGALDRRGVRRVHHARRPDDVAARRRRPRHRQRRDLELGHAGEPRAPLRRARQAHRRHRLGREPGRPPVRHRLRRAD